MEIGELAKKIEEELERPNWLKNIRVNIQNFEDKKDDSYIEFVVQNELAKRKSFKLYSKWSKIIRLNCPGILINYNNPHPLHNNNLRRIKVQFINEQTINEKQDLLNQAAAHFYKILKNENKYQKKD